MEVEGTEDVSLNMEPLDGNFHGNEASQEGLKHRMAADFMAVLSGAMEGRCFSKCVPNPGARMGRSEERCLMQCMDGFLKAWNITSETVRRISAKAAGGGAE